MTRGRGDDEWRSRSIGAEGAARDDAGERGKPREKRGEHESSFVSDDSGRDD